MNDAPPLIVTLALNDAAQEFFNKQRRLYFPAHINFLQAHLTLFHHLPSDDSSIINFLMQQCLQQKPMTLQVTSVVHMGRGVAYKIENNELQALHKAAQKAFEHVLIPQDRQKLWPHISVQNKVTPAASKQLLQQLQQSFYPFAIEGVGLSLFHYQNGPWKVVQTIPFAQ